MSLTVDARERSLIEFLAKTGVEHDVATLPLGDVSTLDIPAGSEERVGSVTSSQLLEAPRPYILVLDDVLEFKVQEFPSNSTVASFPISVASILNNTDMEERLKNPRRPSELTVTLVQEPSIKEKKWGVEIKITFRCAEVRPDSRLAMQKPEQDEKGRWKQSSLDDRMKRMRIHLKNIGKPKEKIEEEIRRSGRWKKGSYKKRKSVRRQLLWLVSERVTSKVPLQRRSSDGKYFMIPSASNSAESHGPSLPKISTRASSERWH